MLSPTQEEIQFFFSFPSEKIKTPHTQADTTKTIKCNIDNGLQERQKEGLLLTCGIANKGFSGMRSAVARFKVRNVG